ncbi:unnamed protein product [Rhizoctonia solani]|nr:unnamed protein product [Rhizoctonia solani]
MPFRQGVKQALKKAEDNLKQAGDDIITMLKGSVSSRPSTPSGSQTHTGSFNMHEQAGEHVIGLLATPLPTQSPMSPSLAARQDRNSNVGQHSEQPSQPSSPIKKHHLDVIELSTRAPAVPLPQASEHASVNVAVDNDGSNSTPVKPLAPGKTLHEKQEEAPTRDFKQLATEVVGQVADTLKIGPLRDVLDMLQGFADMYKMEGAVKTEYEALQHRLRALLKVLEAHSELSTSPMVASKVTGIREFIKGELDLIEKQLSGKQHGRLLIAQQEEERFVGCCRRIQEYMERISLDANLSTWKLEDEDAKDRMSSWIRLLPSSPSAWYNSSAGRDLKRRECAPGTRVAVLANLLAWANGSNKDAVYWLNGMAGTGKTTIAYSVCTELAGKKKLAASFFCSRLREECRDVNRIIPSIAYQLAQFSPPFRLALSVIMENEQDAHHKVLSEQFEALIRRPLLAVLSAQPLIPEMMVVVIDALDECENKDNTRDILNVFLDKAVGLPIKFVMSSRPEPQIRDEMTDGRVKSRLVLHELDTGGVQADIETYVREELKSMNPALTESQIAALVNKAGILFIYAATAVRYIGHDNFHRNPHARLRALLDRQQTLKTKKKNEIDVLYTTILEAALGDQDIGEEEQNDMEQVIYTVICAREPLTVSDLSELLEIKDVERVRAALRPLWSVFHVVGANELVTTLHASFPDFMFDPGRSDTYHCDLEAHNRTLAEHCLELIKQTQPQFNICRLESSYLPDDKVPSIQERVADAISSDLLYACRYWSNHVEAGKCASTLAIRLQDFLSTRLLLWMEVLNLTKHMSTGVDCMKMLTGWCNQFDSDEELVELANDARRFVEIFASNPVSQSTPHIYISMLAFWPRSAPIAKHYTRFSHGPVQAEGTALDQRELAYLAKWTFTDAIHTMAVSQDGRQIALGVRSDILVVDSSSGQVVLGPLHGHPNVISTIMFSPDHKRVLAGSFNRDEFATVIGWDTRTGNTVVGPLQLKSSIACLTLSPDFACIAAGSADRSVRLWDLESGKMLRCWKTNDWVSVTVFSSDGILIAAGLSDALRVWNSRTGVSTLGLLSTGLVDMIAFSSDSSRIIHARRFTTVHVRDVQNGQLIYELNPRRDIYSIGYSPDVRYIITGHYQTVNVWDAQNGNMKIGPLKGHRDWVSAIAFSPDGSRIISACQGGLVCTWDARQHNLAPDSICMHTSGILFAKFSPDGQHLSLFSKMVIIWR